MRRDMKIAIYAITGQGCKLAKKIAVRFEKPCDLFVPERFADSCTPGFAGGTFASGKFTSLLNNNWKEYSGHVFVMATGIVVRKIAPLLEHKTKDPAVVVCDEVGSYAISLLSGHIGGANRLTHAVASTIGAAPVITTGTDVQNLMAFDELAAINGWTVCNPENIKFLNSMLLETRPIAVMLPADIFDKEYSTKKNLFRIDSLGDLKGKEYEGLVLLDCELPEVDTVPVLLLSK